MSYEQLTTTLQQQQIMIESSLIRRWRSQLFCLQHAVNQEKGLNYVNDCLTAVSSGVGMA